MYAELASREGGVLVGRLNRLAGRRLAGANDRGVSFTAIAAGLRRHYGIKGPVSGQSQDTP